ncbi:MAG: hypothetical protein GY788_07515 [bacterium]|nr:hypothetical protein [bacterium]
MSYSTIPLILQRIETARQESPIAVFRIAEADMTDKRIGLLNAAYANTSGSKARIERGDPLYIGSFYRAEGGDLVASMPSRATEKSAVRKILKESLPAVA